MTTLYEAWNKYSPNDKEDEYVSGFDSLTDKIKNSTTTKVILYSAGVLLIIFLMGHVFQVITKTVIAGKQLYQAVRS